MENIIQGFSRLSREEKIRVAAETAAEPVEFARVMFSHWHPELKSQELYTNFTENAVSNFYLPYSLAPNFRINNRNYIIPMVTEESSVVAAASAAAKFWWPRGGFHTRIRSMIKPGHIYFTWTDGQADLESFISGITPALYNAAAPAEQSMKTRGGGIQHIRLKQTLGLPRDHFQLEVGFLTADAMGANFMNTCLEAISARMYSQAADSGLSDKLEIIMAILSNYTPECVVECYVSCPVKEFELLYPDLTAEAFVKKFVTAVNIAQYDVYRAVTHNKGIFNGMDAVIMATGNDFRAAEASGHAWAAKDGSYKGLSQVKIHNSQFEFGFDLPLSVGVVGGLTTLHPMAKASLQLLGNPHAEELMSVIAACGLANHFSAIKALITTGIQKGHMKLHLSNILGRLNATPAEKAEAESYFTRNEVSFSAVRDFIKFLRET